MIIPPLKPGQQILPAAGWYTKHVNGRLPIAFWLVGQGIDIEGVILNEQSGASRVSGPFIHESQIPSEKD